MATKKRTQKGAAKRRDGNPNTAQGDGLFANAGIASVIALLGLVVTFGLVWWQVIEEPKQATAELQKERLLSQYTQLFNGRIAELRAQVGAMAESAAVSTAFDAPDPDGRAELAALLADQHPFISRVAIIERGRAEVDLNAEVPISFAALDLIRRAETTEFVGPEVSLNQRNLIYAAQPVTTNGLVAGVLLVVFDSEFFLNPLSHFEASLGTLKIIQNFEGTPSTTVMEWGNQDLNERAKEAQLYAPHWTLSFQGNTSALMPRDTTSDLLLPVIVALLVTIAAIFLGFSRYARMIRDDTQRLTEHTSRTVRRKSGVANGFNLGIMQDAAETITALLATPAKNQAGTPHATGNSTQEHADVDGDLTADDTPATESTATIEADDFLEVSNASHQENFGIEVKEDVSPMDMGLELDQGIFRAYDIRGITTQNLTEEVVYWIGRSFGMEAQAADQTRVVVGCDGRHSSQPLMKSLCRGLTESGVEVMTIGQVPTPVLYYATYALDTGTGIMITGSHNPPEYNGLKMMIDGVTLAEERIQSIYQRIVDNDLGSGDGSSDVEEIDLDDSYIDKVLEDVVIAQSMKVVVDCGNGVAGKIAPRLLTELGCEVIPLYCDVDGDFPNHHPDPAEPENLEDLRTVVEAEQADLGLAFDGDGDRVGVITNSGEIIWPDKLVMLFAQDIVSRNPGADIIYDVKCSRHLNSIVSELGGRPIMWKTGHSHIKAKIKETNALLGGEFSGHICFGERWYGFDDALYSAVRLLEILSTEGRTADEVFAQFPVTFTTPELKITTTEEAKFEIVKRLEIDGDFGDGTLTTIDGIRVDFEDGWGLIRASNTSPVLSLRFEADEEGALDRIQDLFQAQLHAIDPTLTFR